MGVETRLMQVEELTHGQRAVSFTHTTASPVPGMGRGGCVLDGQAALSLVLAPQSSLSLVLPLCHGVGVGGGESAPPGYGGS